MRKYLYAAGCLLLIVTFLEGAAFAQDDVLAKFGGKTITVSDYNKIIGYLDPEKQKVIEKNPQLKENVLRQLIQSMVLSELARKAGFDKRPEVQEQLKVFTDNFLANEYLRKEIAAKVTVSEDDVKSYYDTHQDEFKTPEMIKARHILIKVDKSASEEDKKQARKKAEDILSKIKAGEDFAKLASEFSDDPGSKSKGGDLDFFARGRMVKPFEDAAFALKPGEVSGIVESPFGYHIIKVDETKDAGVEPYDTAKDKIKQKLVQERTKSKLTEFVEETMKDANVEMHPELLTGSQNK